MVLTEPLHFSHSCLLIFLKSQREQTWAKQINLKANIQWLYSKFTKFTFCWLFLCKSDTRRLEIFFSNLKKPDQFTEIHYAIKKVTCALCRKCPLEFTLNPYDSLLGSPRPHHPAADPWVLTSPLPGQSPFPNVLVTTSRSFSSSRLLSWY